MYAGHPISLLNHPEYDRRSAEVTSLFEALDPHRAWELAEDLGIDHIYVGDDERAALAPEALAKFEGRPDLFGVAFSNPSVRIYTIRPPPAVPASRSSGPPPGTPES
jgi:uncharacterized membrane protein